MTILNAPTQHGGIVVPLDMFRVSHLASVISEVLVGKARNVIDAQMVVTRHPSAQIVLITINGSVIGDDPAQFWRENADLAIALSQVLRTQCFLYYATTAPAEDRREGFVVAQRGQALAADDASADTQPAGGEGHWPVTKLCEQLRISMSDLASGFEGGPTVSLSVMEPSIDDQEALKTLAEPPPGEGGAQAQAQAAPEADAPAAKDAGPPKPKKPTMEEDLKRRANARAAEAEAMQERAAQVQDALVMTVDTLGVVVCPKAELGEPDILGPFIVSNIEGDLPAGVPSEHTSALQGKRSDIAVRVDFFSEVFSGNATLTKPEFAAQSTTQKLGGLDVKVMEVLAPRLGYGTLVSQGKAPHVFVSRKPTLDLPGDLIADLLKNPGA